MTNIKLSIAPSGQLMVGIPSVTCESDRINYIEIPCTEAGIKTLYKLVQNAEDHARRHALATIGTDAAPTQEMVKEWLRHNEPQRVEKIPTKLDRDIEELGLDLEGVEL